MGSIQSLVRGTVRRGLVPWALERLLSASLKTQWTSGRRGEHSGGIWGAGWFWPGPCPQLFSCLLPSLWKKKNPCGTVHRTQDSPSRARPRSPAAGNAAGGVAGGGGAGHGVGGPPGEHGAYSESSAAVTGAASPRQRGTSRNGGASGDRTGGSAGQPWASGTHSPHRGRLAARGCLQEPLRRRECVWVLAL